MTLIRDRYERLETIGRGGQGEVIKALDHLHARPVALKVRPIRSQSERDEILDEAKILRALRPHPAVTLVREDFFYDDAYVMVMDWIDGRSLDQIVGEDGALPLDQAARFLSKVAEALDHMHDHDPPVVHGDVKPANIVVNPDGHVVLVDFGIAVRGDTASRMSTARYAAPEAARGERLTPAADIYSLGATAIALLTGEPFAFGVRPRLEESRTESRRIERVLARALHPDPARRHRSAGAFVDALFPSAPHNLPAPVTSFIGRRRELRDVRALIRRARLATLAGPGGVGKTRLALTAAAAALGEFPGGVWFVQLASLEKESLVNEQIARTLDVPPEGGKSAEDRVADFIGDRRTLVVLDNAEHLVDGVARAAIRLLGACPKLAMLTTSRQPLGIPGEEVIRVPPLAVPSDPAAAKRAEAVRLFCDRARASHRAFRLSAQTAPAVTEICRRLDGMPLALELAAARIGSFTPAELSTRLDERFRLLVAPGEQLPHHRTLRATVEWSVALLSDAERTLLTRLAVFAGGFTLDAARVVCAGDGIDSEDISSLIASLVEKSLVLRDDHDTESSYRMLETVRAFARETLDDPVRARHLAWCASLAEPGEGDATWLERLANVMDDLRAALGWGVKHAPHDALALACSVAQLWLVRGHFAEGRAWIERALAGGAEHVDRALQARALNTAGNLARGAADYEAAGSFLDRCLAIRREAGDRAGEAKALNGLGVVAMDRGDNARARFMFEQSAAIGRELDDDALVDAPVGNLGIIAVAEHDFEQARACHSESLAIARKRGDVVGIAYSLENLGIVEKHLGNTEAAVGLYRESLALLRDVGDARAMAELLLLFGEIALDEERFDDAVWLFAAADAARERIGAPLPEYARPELDRAVAAMRAGIGDEAFEQAWAAGRAITLSEAVASLLLDPQGADANHLPP